MKSIKTNINTIAKMAGVSTTTVSNFINCAETIPISAGKRERIMEAMRSTNYRPSSASSQLRRNSILLGKAVFIFGGNPECNPFDTCKNPMLSELISKLASELQDKMGLSMEIRAICDEDSTEAWNETIADADSIICYGKLDANLLQLSLRRNIPLVVISDNKTTQTRGISGTAPLIDCVYWDAASHLETIMEHLTDKGARRLAFVSSWNIERNHKIGFAVEAEAKIAKFKEFVASDAKLSGEIFCPPMPLDVSPYFEGRNAYEFIRKEDRVLKDFDAIIGHNDFVAQGIAGAMMERGLKPGCEILLCGEGDYAECRHAVPAVTTISYDKGLLAGLACKILKRRLSDNRPRGEHLPVPSRMIERESTGGHRQ